MSALIIKIEGGLGNQLLQYMFGQSLSRLHNNDVFFDISEYVEGRGIRRFALAELGLPGKFISCKKIISADGKYVHLRRIKAHGKSLKLSTWFTLHKKFPLVAEREQGTLQDFSAVTFAYLSGYWVSFEYWHHPTELAQWMNGHLDRTASTRTGLSADSPFRLNNACALHVRRGDYLNPEHIAWHGTCSIEYFKRATTALASSHNLFLSDDLSFIDKEFIDVPGYINGSALINSDIDEFLYLRSAKALVISNSTFSYVAALLSTLGQVDTRVIAPYPWWCWGTAHPPFLSSWRKLNAQNGNFEENERYIAAQADIAVLLSGFESDDELHRAIKMLMAQSKVPSELCIQVTNESSSCRTLEGMPFLPTGSQPHISFVFSSTEDEFVLQALPLISSEFLTVLRPDETWLTNKLQIEVEAAVKLKADVITSPFCYADTTGKPAIYDPLSIPVSNRQAVLHRTRLCLMVGLGSALIKTKKLVGFTSEPIYKLGLSDCQIFIQHQYLSHYGSPDTIRSNLLNKLTALQQIGSRVSNDSQASQELKDVFSNFMTVVSKIVSGTAATPLSFAYSAPTPALTGTRHVPNFFMRVVHRTYHYLLKSLKN